jgi:agmatinase
MIFLASAWVHDDAWVMTYQKKIVSFDPNAPGVAGSNLFGLPFTVAEARVVVLPVPWEVTVSYGGGTLEGPEAVREASRQVDLYDPEVPDAWKIGVAMDRLPPGMKARSKRLRREAEQVIAALEEGRDPGRDPVLRRKLAAVNRGCAATMDEVERRCGELLDAGKLVALLGGDHSTPLGLLRALGARHRSFGVLQIDAHADLRVAYEGFTYSHASICHNALAEVPAISRLVQVGLRDVCEQEVAAMGAAGRRIRAFFDRDLAAARFAGKTVAAQHRAIVASLPRNVYVTFDIDGLDPSLCPHTGTPVPGGLGFEEALHLVRAVVVSGRRIIGLDLNEVSPGGGTDWDANVGARLLYRLLNLMARSQDLA